MAARRLLVLIAASGLAFAGCGGDDDSSSPSTSPDTASTTEATTTTTAAPTTTAPPPSTTEATTTTLATTTTASTTSTTEPAPTPDLGPAPTTAYAIVDTDLVELDPATGTTGRVIAEFFNSDGVFRGTLQVTPDRAGAFFSESYEDAWYGCESSVGSIGWVDLASGEFEVRYAGTSPSLSPDGTRLAYLASEVCVPDPEAPEMWVLTPYDRVVVVDLASGESVVLTTAAPPADYGDPNSLQWVGFHPGGDALVLTSAGDVHQIPSGEATVVQEHPVVASAPPFPHEIVGETLLGIDVGDEGATRVVATALDEAGAATTLWESEYPVTIGVGPLGHVIVGDSDPSGTSTASGAVTVIAFPDSHVRSIDW